MVVRTWALFALARSWYAARRSWVGSAFGMAQLTSHLGHHCISGRKGLWNINRAAFVIPCCSSDNQKLNMLPRCSSVPW